MKRSANAEHLIIGKHAVEEVLRVGAERLSAVFIARSKGQASRRYARLVEEIERRGIPIEYRTGEELSAMCGTESHQSFVAQLKPKQLENLKHWLTRLSDSVNLTVLALDSILDPHNMGAILRAAECFGVDLVLWSKNRGCGITPVVSGASVGASELVPLCEVANLAQSIELLRDEGFAVVVADSSPDSSDLYGFSWSARVVLVMGGEEQGVQDLIQRRADCRIRIPMHGQISSLNVSQASAVMLAECRRNRARA